ncbi:MAG: hypothetical protein EPO24_04415 [Bacteroidetes bacterium]|nr:MAG: hypothetical protein EPO24_04415 [Bacteroidota bacterium]
MLVEIFLNRITVMLKGYSETLLPYSMKIGFLILVAFLIISCNRQHQSQPSTSAKPATQNARIASIRLILPASLERRRTELQNYFDAATRNIQNFSSIYEWGDLAKEEFMDSVMFFDDKHQFNIALLTLAEADTTMKLADTYCAALEKKTLVAMTPEFYSKVFPEGIEEHSFEKLLTHEIAHRLHVRILKGDEEAMGPIWFYEGFAMFAADQLSKSNIVLSNGEMIKLMNEAERGSYSKYNYIFRYFVKAIPLKELLAKAKNNNFNEELIAQLH